MRPLLNRIEAAFGAAVQIRNFGRSEKFVVEAEFASAHEIAAWLRMEENFRFDFLEAFTVYEAKNKLVLSYFLRSHSQNHQLVLRTSTPVPGAQELASVPSAVGIWPHAEAFETELAPLFGIEFTGSRGAGAVRKNFGSYGGFPLRKTFEWREEIAP
ncbi:MAG: NADH-quinone oxidoreductase subunit C [Bdellovibrionales bacterium]|nr:NADH-quinone oxidoreductase subunit C [Bdellovibrionales bacterium]